MKWKSPSRDVSETNDLMDNVITSVELSTARSSTVSSLIAFSL